MPKDSVVKTEMIEISFYRSSNFTELWGQAVFFKTVEETLWHKLLEQSNI